MTVQPTPHEPPEDDEDLSSLDELLDAGDERRTGRHRDPLGPFGYRMTWLRLAERVIGGWAPTLRTAIPLAGLLAAGIAAVLLVWGAVGMVCAVVLCILLRRAATVRHRRISV